MVLPALITPAPRYGPSYGDDAKLLQRQDLQTTDRLLVGYFQEPNGNYSSANCGDEWGYFTSGAYAACIDVATDCTTGSSYLLAGKIRTCPGNSEKCFTHYIHDTPFAPASEDVNRKTYIKCTGKNVTPLKPTLLFRATTTGSPSSTTRSATSPPATSTNSGSNLSFSLSSTSTSSGVPTGVSNSNDSLSTGAIAGIAVGSVAAVLLIAAIILLLIFMRRLRRIQKADRKLPEMDGEHQALPNRHWFLGGSWRNEAEVRPQWHELKDGTDIGSNRHEMDCPPRPVELHISSR